MLIKNYTDDLQPMKGVIMKDRVFNFNPGPATLPETVLRTAQEEFLNYKDEGMSVMEMSHRSKGFEAIINEAVSNIKKVMGFSDNYSVLFVQGGATGQFAAVPLNLARAGKPALLAFLDRSEAGPLG